MSCLLGCCGGEPSNVLDDSLYTAWLDLELEKDVLGKGQYGTVHRATNKLTRGRFQRGSRASVPDGAPPSIARGMTRLQIMSWYGASSRPAASTDAEQSSRGVAASMRRSLRASMMRGRPASGTTAREQAHSWPRLGNEPLPPEPPPRGNRRGLLTGWRQNFLGSSKNK